MIDHKELDKLITAYTQAEQGAPEKLESYLLANVDEVAEKLKQRDRLAERTDMLERGIGEFQEIMDNSEGVAGWHLNDAVAPWGELLNGLNLEDWIVENGKEKGYAKGEGDATGDEPD